MTRLLGCGRTLETNQLFIPKSSARTMAHGAMTRV